MADTGGTEEVGSGSPSGRVGYPARAGEAAGSGEEVPSGGVGDGAGDHAELPPGEPVGSEEGEGAAAKVNGSDLAHGCHNEGPCSCACSVDHEKEQLLPPLARVAPSSPPTSPPVAPILPTALPLSLSLPAATALASLYSPAPASFGRISDASPADPLTLPRASLRAATFRCKEEGGTAGCTGDSCTEPVRVSDVPQLEEEQRCASSSGQARLPSLRCPVLVEPSGGRPAVGLGASSSAASASADDTGRCILCTRCSSFVDTMDATGGCVSPQPRANALEICMASPSDKTTVPAESPPASQRGFAPVRRTGSTMGPTGASAAGAGEPSGADQEQFTSRSRSNGFASHVGSFTSVSGQTPVSPSGHRVATPSDTIEIIITEPEPFPNSATSADNSAIADVVGHAVSSMAQELEAVMGPERVVRRLSDPRGIAVRSQPDSADVAENAQEGDGSIAGDAKGDEAKGCDRLEGACGQETEERAAAADGTLARDGGEGSEDCPTSRKTKDCLSNAETSGAATASGTDDVQSVAVARKKSMPKVPSISSGGTNSLASSSRQDNSTFERRSKEEVTDVPGNTPVGKLASHSSLRRPNIGAVFDEAPVELPASASTQMRQLPILSRRVSTSRSLSPRSYSLSRRKGVDMSPKAASWGRRRFSTPSWEADNTRSPRDSVSAPTSPVCWRGSQRSRSDLMFNAMPTYSTQQMRWQGNTPAALEDAVMTTDTRRINELVASGVSVNVPCVNVNHGPHQPKFTTLLHKIVGMPGHAGAFKNHAVKDTLEALISCQANLNPRSSDGQTPLIIACQRKNLQAVKILLESGAEISPIDDNGSDCLREAIKLGTQRQSKAKRSGFGRSNSHEGARLDARSIHESKESSSTGDGVPGSDALRSEDQEGEAARAWTIAVDFPVGDVTPSLATSTRHTSLDDISVPKVQSLSQSEISELVANLYVPGCVGGVACQSSSPSHSRPCPPGCEGCLSAELVRMILPPEPTFSAAEEDGDLICEADQEESRQRTLWEQGQALVQRGQESGKGACPLYLAVTQLNHEAVTALTERGMKPTYLHKAVTTGSLQTVKALLDAQADPLAVNHDGETAIDVALRNREDASIIDVLRRAMSLKAHSRNNSPGRSSCRRGTRTSSAGSEGQRRSRKTLTSTVERRTKRASDECEDYVMSMEEERKAGTLCRRCLQTRRLVTDRVYNGLAELSQQCRNLYALHTAQAISFMLVLGALFLPDVWVLAQAHNDESLDLMLVVLVVGFLIELIVQAIGFRRAYIGTFFFSMDVIGTASLFLDLSKFRHLTGNSVGGTVVIMRAARAAKLGARAGRFTRLVKLLRYLPGIANPEGQQQTCTAHALSRILVTKLSTRVSCLIILLVVILPFPAIFTYPQEDWSMMLWCKEIENTIVETDNWELVDQVIEDCQEAYVDKAYHPHSVRHRTPAGEIILWTSTSTLWPDDERIVEHGSVLLAFDFSLSRRHEASANVFMTLFAIFLLVGFSLMLSSSVSTIAVRPLEAMLLQVRTIGSTIYRHVEQMQQAMNKDEKAKHGHQMSIEAEEADMADETALLEQVVRKLTALGVIVMNKEAKANKLCLEYLGEEAKNSVDKVEKNQRMSTLGEDTQDLGVDTLPIRLGSVSVMSLCSWDYNIRTIEKPHVNAVCQAMLSSALAKTGSPCSSEVLNRFVDAAEAGYLPGPQYHNWLHAADVTHVLFVMMRKCCGRQGVLLGWLEESALLFAAMCHDIGHVGLSNDFLVATQHEYAMRYNDTSVLENYHCARLFELLMDPRTAVFDGFTHEDFKEVRSVCINAILHTDNVHHAAVVKQLQLFCEVHSELLEQSWEVCSGAGADSKSRKTFGGGRQWPPHDLIAAFWEPDNRAVLRSSLLHFADVSNPLRPFSICREWSICVLEEFFAQGDLEKQKNLPVGPLNDRQKVNHPFSQIAFIEFFIAPMAFSMVRIMVPLEDLLDALLINIDKWAEEWVFVYGHKHSDDEISNVSNRIKRLQERRAQIGKQPERKHRSTRRVRSRSTSVDV